MSQYNNQKTAVTNPELDTVEIASFNQSSELQLDISKGLGVLQAINGVHKDIINTGGIQKSRQTDASNVKFCFSYRGIDDFYNALSSIIAENGLIILPNVISTKTMRYYNTKNEIMFKTLVVVKYTILCEKDGSSVSVTMAGECNDSGDKGMNKALSNAQKYMYILPFSIPTESDHGQHDQQQHHQQQQAPRQQPQGRSQPHRSTPQDQFLDSVASPEARKMVNDMMTQHNNSLKAVLSSRNIDPRTLTHRQLENISREFKEFIDQEIKTPAN